MGHSTADVQWFSSTYYKLWLDSPSHSRGGGGVMWGVMLGFMRIFIAQEKKVSLCTLIYGNLSDNHIDLSNASALALCSTRVIAPAQANIVDIKISQLSINCCEDLNSCQITKVLSELNIGQFASSRFSARWYGDILINGPYHGSQRITVDRYLAVRRPVVFATDPKREGINPECTIECTRSGAKLSDQLEARTRGSVDVEAISDSIHGKLRRRMWEESNARWRNITEMFLKV